VLKIRRKERPTKASEKRAAASSPETLFEREKIVYNGEREKEQKKKIILKKF